MGKSTGKFARYFYKVIEESLLDGLGGQFLKNQMAAVTSGPSTSDVDLKAAVANMGPTLQLNMYRAAEAGGGDDDLAAMLNKHKDYSSWVEGDGGESAQRVLNTLEQNPGTAQKILQFLKVDPEFQRQLKSSDKEQADNEALTEMTAADAGVGSTGGADMQGAGVYGDPNDMRLPKALGKVQRRAGLDPKKKKKKKKRAKKTKSVFHEPIKEV